MGGPFWARKDEGAWSVIKGEHEVGDDPLEAARREWTEETGTAPPEGELVALGEVRQKSGKRVTAWAVEAPGLDPAGFVSNTFEMEWPPRSGRMQQFPEIDRAAWMPVEEAAGRLVVAQRPLLEVLAASLHAR
ncbi:MAG: NUDIX domain-containing protein [Solirubrobacteraceae bacterium]|nr:NUDIX domain-containing protein [Solirubrobacteraceae bacterium]